MEKQAEMQTPTSKRKIILLIVPAIAVLAIGVSWCLLQPKSQGNEGVLAPDFSLLNLEGNSFRLSDFRGNVVVLDFMTTWCGGCRDEIPHLRDVWEKEEYKNRIVLVSIDIDSTESAENLRSFVQDFEYATWIWARDTANLAQAYEVVYVPKTIIIDTDGYIRFTHDTLTDASVLIGEIDELLR